MTTVALDVQGTDEDLEGDSDGDGEASGQDDPPDPVPLAARTIPCTVWFGPKTSESLEREMAAFLGSHNGVAVLQWSRDVARATHLHELGIPCLCFVRTGCEYPVGEHDLEEWLPQYASDQRVHDSLVRLSERALARRTAPPVLEGDCVRLGESGVQLSPGIRDLASVLIAHFDQAVDDSVLSRTSERVATTRRSLFSDLLHLDQCVNQIGLEIVPVRGEAHRIRRCFR
jgi:hypothetical protein